MRTPILVSLLLLALALAACGGSSAPAASVGQPDPAAGEALFKLECASCHSVQAGVSLAGPSLAGAGAGGAETLRRDIVDPNAELAEGFAQGIMPDSFGARLTTQQVDDLVAYLLTLK